MVGKKTGAKCLVWHPYAGKTTGCYQEDKENLRFFVNLRSLPAAQIMTLSLRMTTVGFCFSFGVWLVVEGLRAHLQIHDRILLLFSHIHFF